MRSTNFENGLTTSEISGAVVACILRDLEVNYFAFAGFPGIELERDGDDFKVTLFLVNQGKTHTAQLTLSRAEAFEAAKQWKKYPGKHYEPIFRTVQAACVAIERSYLE